MKPETELKLWKTLADEIREVLRNNEMTRDEQVCCIDELLAGYTFTKNCFDLDYTTSANMFSRFPQYYKLSYDLMYESQRNHEDRPYFPQEPIGR